MKGVNTRHKVDKRAITSTGPDSLLKGVGGDDCGAGTGWDVQTFMVVSSSLSETPVAMI